MSIIFKHQAPNWHKLTNKEDLKEGDLIRNIGSGQGYVVIHRGKNIIIAERTIEVTNPMEWEVLK